MLLKEINFKKIIVDTLTSVNRMIPISISNQYNEIWSTFLNLSEIIADNCVIMWGDTPLLYSQQACEGIIKNHIVIEAFSIARQLQVINYMMLNDHIKDTENLTSTDGYSGFSITNQDGDFKKNKLNRENITTRSAIDFLQVKLNDYCLELINEILDKIIVTIHG